VGYFGVTGLSPHGHWDRPIYTTRRRLNGRSQRFVAAEKFFTVPLYVVFFIAALAWAVQSLASFAVGRSPLSLALSPKGRGD
jgi:hypothetical protein